MVFILEISKLQLIGSAGEVSVCPSKLTFVTFIFSALYHWTENYNRIYQYFSTRSCFDDKGIFLEIAPNSYLRSR